MVVGELGAGEIILWAAVLGLLVGIVWSLKYIVLIDRKLDRILRKVEREERKELRVLSRPKRKKAKRRRR